MTAAGHATSRRVVTVAGAMAAALSLWALIDPVLGLDLTVAFGGSVRPVTAASVVAASLVAGLAAWGLLAVLERTRMRPRRTWTVIALVVLALSLTGPLGSAVDTASSVTLLGMHLMVAAVLIPGLPRPARTN